MGSKHIDHSSWLSLLNIILALGLTVPDVFIMRGPGGLPMAS